MTVCQPVIAGVVVRRIGRERPDLALAWYDSDGSLLDLSTYSFTLSIAESEDSPALLTKTTGISYVVADDYNVQITFLAGELDATTFDVGVPYNCQLDAVSGSADRGFQDFIMIFTPEHS